jgi:hypothetical protein
LPVRNTSTGLPLTNARKPYPKYKPSGGDSLGPIPEHWQSAPVKRVSAFSPSKEEPVHAFLGGAPRGQLDQRLDRACARYLELDSAEQIAFKGSAKAFTRTDNFLSAILSFGFPERERLSIYPNLLLPRLPAPIEDDPGTGILETVILGSYRTQNPDFKRQLSDDIFALTYNADPGA